VLLGVGARAGPTRVVSPAITRGQQRMRHPTQAARLLAHDRFFVATGTQRRVDVSEPELVRLRDGWLRCGRPRPRMSRCCARSWRAVPGGTASAAFQRRGGHELCRSSGGRDERGSLRAGRPRRDGRARRHALYVQLDRTRAEVAVEVADHLHDRGLGTIFIERLAAVAGHHALRGRRAARRCWTCSAQLRDVSASFSAGGAEYSLDGCALGWCLGQGQRPPIAPGQSG
jgi:hypothetical protein